MNKLEFIKMHGLGNDFVVIDVRNQKLHIDRNLITKISDRRTGAGCDQIISINHPTLNNSDGKITIYNANGDEAEACGNGTRCVAKILFEELNKNKLTIESAVGILEASLGINKDISVNMGIISEQWDKIPLSHKMDTRNISINIEGFTNGFASNIGNSHVVFFVKNVDELKISDVGPKIENHIYFPKKTNVEFIEVLKNCQIKMRVWERGVGETLACGSGACAAAFASYIRGLTKKECDVVLKKGVLNIKIKDNNAIIMTGPAEISYYGSIEI